MTAPRPVPGPRPGPRPPTPKEFADRAKESVGARVIRLEGRSDEYDSDIAWLKDEVERLSAELASVRKQTDSLFKELALVVAAGGPGGPRPNPAQERQDKALRFLQEHAPLVFSPIALAQNIGEEEHNGALGSQLRRLAERGIIINDGKRSPLYRWNTGGPVEKPEDVPVAE